MRYHMLTIPENSIEASAEKPPHRMAAEKRRQQIIDVAIQLFSQKGFRGTTTKEIALAAGVNEAIIFRHFATKRDLYSAIIDQKACATEMVAKQADVVRRECFHHMHEGRKESLVCGVEREWSPF